MSWRRMIRILAAVHLMAAAGFSMVMPFLPLYVKKLGIHTGGSVAFWSAMIFSAPAFTMMIAAPVWGMVADRYGRKPMLVRSTVAGAVLIALMGFAQSAEQLAVLRAGQGMLTGYIAASNALVSASTPKQFSGESFGLLRTASWVGTGLGPLLGGLVAEHVGFRESFWITGGLLGLASLVVMFGVRERFERPEPKLRGGLFRTYFSILKVPEMRRIYSLSFLDSLGRSMLLPILPLYILRLTGTPTGVATVTGLLLGLRAFAGAASSVFVGRLGDRIGHGKVVVIGAVGLAVLYLPQAHVTAAWQLVALQFLTGFAAVGIIPGIGALMNIFVPPGASGATFGLESSLDSLARTIGPLLGAGIALTAGKSAVFAIAAAVYLFIVLRTLPLRGVVASRGDSAASRS